MPEHFDVEQDNARFSRLFRRVITLFAVLISIYLIVSTGGILLDSPAYLHDWRGITCIALVLVVFLLYIYQFRMGIKLDWPPPLRYSLSLWLGFYIALFLLTLINNSFVWDFYVLYSIGFGLFGGGRLWLAVICTSLTLFAFQGLLVWPPTPETLIGIAGQGLTMFSLAGLNVMFQHLVGERFERNSLFKKLTQANRELEEAHRRLAQSVAQEQELAVLRERTRLAREMHDTIGHALVLISVKLEAAQRLRERNPERCDQELGATKQIARETMTALRASIADLRSPALEHERLDLALSRTAHEFARRSNLHVTYTFQADIDQLPEAIEETLWKVSQEAFTNIEKHARASHVQVQISRQDEKLLMQIHDDGIGLPPALSQQNVYDSPDGHYGLRGMHERVEAAGGQLTLRSGPGTTIEVELPLASCSAVVSKQEAN